MTQHQTTRDCFGGFVDEVHRTRHLATGFGRTFARQRSAA
jgi:hypothetical protein